jgi:benzylsuccinate CoA-transferase BbsF subunit/naphthyl-2-methylsuccinate CoA transferase subunit
MDPASGTAAAFAALCAIRQRRATGEGALVELAQSEKAQSENMLQHIGEYLIDASRTGRVHGPIGNRHVTYAPQGCYRAAGDNRWVTISVRTDEEWRGLRRAMGDPSWATEPKYDDVAGRRTAHDEIDDHISEWTRALDRFEVFERCQREGVPAGPVLDEVDATRNEHLRVRRFWRANGSVEVGEHQYPNHLWKWDGPPLRWGPISRMGRDNEHVWKTIAGLNDTEYEAMQTEGHLSLDYLQPNGQSF